MSFQLHTYQLDEPIEAFKFCIHQLGMEMKEAQMIIAKRRLLMEGEIVSEANALIKGEIGVYIFEPNTQALVPIFEHEDFAIFDKPSGVDSMPRNRASDYSMVHEARYRYGKEANITHRLDHETSGLIIISKTKQAEAIFKNMFEQKLITKTYQAIIKGKLATELTLEIPLVKTQDHTFSKHKVVVAPGGKMAITHVSPIDYHETLKQTKVELIPITGRMHQLRVHLFHIFHAIVGDPLYGTKFEFANRYLDKETTQEERIEATGASRLMLHAKRLEFHYGEEFIQIESPLNLDFNE
jgi:23S rRNA pseudouridine1911/1915/1917 synthase